MPPVPQPHRRLQSLHKLRTGRLVSFRPRHFALRVRHNVICAGPPREAFSPSQPSWRPPTSRFMSSLVFYHHYDEFLSREVGFWRQTALDRSSKEAAIVIVVLLSTMVAARKRGTMESEQSTTRSEAGGSLCQQRETGLGAKTDCSERPSARG